MAQKAGKKQTRGNRDSRPKYLGVKLFDGQIARPGFIIVRQRGTKILPGLGTKIGKDDTIYAVSSGKVKFITKKIIGFDKKKKFKKIVSVI